MKWQSDEKDKREREKGYSDADVRGRIRLKGNQSHSEFTDYTKIFKRVRYSEKNSVIQKCSFCDVHVV